MDSRLLAFGSVALVAAAGLVRRGSRARTDPEWLSMLSDEPWPPGYVEPSGVVSWWGPSREPQEATSILTVQRMRRSLPSELDWFSVSESRSREDLAAVGDADPDEWSWSRAAVNERDFLASEQHLGHPIPRTFEWAASIGQAMISYGGRGVEERIENRSYVVFPEIRRSFRLFPPQKGSP